MQTSSWKAGRIRFLALCLGTAVALNSTLPAASPREDSLSLVISDHFKAASGGKETDAGSVVLPADLAMAKRIALDAFAVVETQDIDAFELLQPYFESAHNLKDLRQVDSLTFYNSLYRFIDEALPEYSSKELKLQYELLGIVDDTPESKYVVYRCYNDELDFVQVGIAVYEHGRWFLSLEGNWISWRTAIIGSCAFQRMRGRR